MAANLHRLLEVNIGDVLDVHFFAAREPRSHNPASLHHFPHQEPTEYFVVDVPFLHVHEPNIGDHSFLRFHTLFRSFCRVEEYVVDDSSILS